MALKMNGNTITDSTSGYFTVISSSTTVTSHPTAPSEGTFGIFRNLITPGFADIYTNGRWRRLQFLPPVPDPISFVLQEDTGISNTDGITNNGTLIVSGINVINGFWQFSTDAGSTWSLPLPTEINTVNLPEGTYPANSIQMKQTNAVGISSAITTNTSQIIVDTNSSVTINVISGNDYLRSDQDPGITVITGTVDTGPLDKNFVLTFNNITRIPTISGINWSYTITMDDLIALGDGPNRVITATVSDIAGNTATASRSVTVQIRGSEVFITPGTYSWTVPAGINFISAVAVGGGGSSYRSASGVGNPGGSSSLITPSSINVLTANGGSGGQLNSGGSGGGYSAIGGYVTGGGSGGTAGGGSTINGGGGGAGGYSGSGGRGGSAGSSGGSGSGGGGGGGGSWLTSGYGDGGGGGGGVGIYGQGANGSGGGTSFFNAGGGGGSGGTSGVVGSSGFPWNGSNGGLYGGGGGANQINNTGGGGGGGLGYINTYPVTPGQVWSITVGAGGSANGSGGDGKNGAVRIVWGHGRAFPSTDVGVDNPLSISINTVSNDNILRSDQDPGVTAINGSLFNVTDTITVTLTLGTLTRTASVSGNSWSYTITLDDMIALGDGGDKVITATAISSLGQLAQSSVTVTVQIRGSQVFTTPGTYSWTVPAGVTSVSAVCVGGGGMGAISPLDPGGVGGGGGGGLGWKNNIPVTPGSTYTVRVGAGGDSSQPRGGDSFFISSTTVLGGGGGGGNVYGSVSVSSRTPGAGGTYVGDGGGVGGKGGIATTYGWQGGGGAGGYTGGGGDANQGTSGLVANGLPGSGGGGGGGSTGGGSGYPRIAGSGGGVGILGQGANGEGGLGSGQGIAKSGVHGGGGSGGSRDSTPQTTVYPNQMQTGGLYGGGGAASPSGTYYGKGGGGAVRIVWGFGRVYPSTDVGAD